MPGANLQLHSSEFNLTDRKLIDEANKKLELDMSGIVNGLQGYINQGLNLSSSSGQQGQFNETYNRATDLINNAEVAPGNVDLSNYNPYMNLGAQASNELAALSGLGGASSADLYTRYLNNPAVQAQMDLGNRQINSNAAAKGMLGSGAILKSLQSYGQGIAAQGLGQAQQNLYNLAQLGAQSANQYAASLLNKYSTDQQSALAGKQNQAALLGQQVNLLGQNQQANASQLGFLSQLAGQRATLEQQAALQRQSSLAGAASKYKDTYGVGYGGTRSSVNTQYNFS